MGLYNQPIPEYEDERGPLDRSTSVGYLWNEALKGLHNCPRFRADPLIGWVRGRTYPGQDGKTCGLEMNNSLHVHAFLQPFDVRSHEQIVVHFDSLVKFPIWKSPSLSYFSFGSGMPRMTRPHFAAVTKASSALFDRRMATV